MRPGYADPLLTSETWDGCAEFNLNAVKIAFLHIQQGSSYFQKCLIMLRAWWDKSRFVEMAAAVRTMADSARTSPGMGKLFASEYHCFFDQCDSNALELKSGVVASAVTCDLLRMLILMFAITIRDTDDGKLQPDNDNDNELQAEKSMYGAKEHTQTHLRPASKLQDQRLLRIVSKLQPGTSEFLKVLRCPPPAAFTQFDAWSGVHVSGRLREMRTKVEDHVRITSSNDMVEWIHPGWLCRNGPLFFVFDKAAREGLCQDLDASLWVASYYRSYLANLSSLMEEQISIVNMFQAKLLGLLATAFITLWQIVYSHVEAEYL